MKKTMILFFVFVLGTAAFSQAGMINYERRERFLKQKEASELRTIRGFIQKIDTEKNTVLIKHEKGQEERELKSADKNLLMDYSRGQKVNATYNMNSKMLKKIVLIEE